MLWIKYGKKSKLFKAQNVVKLNEIVCFIQPTDQKTQLNYQIKK